MTINSNLRSEEPPPETVGLRLTNLRRRELQITRLGVVLIGIVSLVAGGVGGDNQGNTPALYATLLTVILLTVVSLGQAYSGFNWQKERIELLMSNHRDTVTEASEIISLQDKAQQFEELRAFPQRAEAWYRATLFLIMLSGLLLMVNVWWFFLGPGVVSPLVGHLQSATTLAIGILPPGALPTISLPLFLVADLALVDRLTRR